MCLIQSTSRSRILSESQVFLPRLAIIVRILGQLAPLGIPQARLVAESVFFQLRRGSCHPLLRVIRFIMLLTPSPRAMRQLLLALLNCAQLRLARDE